VLPARILHGDHWLRRMDEKALGALHDGRRPAVVAVARAVSALAEPAFASAVLFVFATKSAHRVRWRAAAAPCLVVASGMVARRKLSQRIARPRPPAAVWLTQPEGFSLPSKHTTLAALTAGACTARARGLPRHAAPLLAAAGVGASRVYLGVHWPTDILAGWLFAEAWLRLAEACLPGTWADAATGTARPGLMAGATPGQSGTCA
jgi:membrane-associated phospholipid phosphatase